MRAHLGALVCVSFSPWAAGQTFSGLGFLPGESASKAVAIARHSGAVIGVSPADPGHSWVWEQESGIQSLPLGAGAEAALICDDGGTIVATTANPNGSVNITWLREGQPATILPDAHLPIVGLSGDGEVVFLSTPDYQFGQLQRWTAAGGLVSLPNGPNLDGDSTHGYFGGFHAGWFGASDFQGIQALGRGWNYYCIPCCGGECSGLFIDHVDFYWSADSGTGVMPNSSDSIRGQILGASEDLFYKIVAIGGSGVGMIVGEQAPFLLPGLTFTPSTPAVISGNGSVASAGDQVWDAANGTRSIYQVLASVGAPFDGWSSLVVTGLDARGRRLCGYGTNPAGRTEAWTAVLACSSADFNGDGDLGTDADIQSFFDCLGGQGCPPFRTPDFNGDGDVGTDADIEAFFRVLAGGTC